MKQIIQSYRRCDIELKEVPAPMCKKGGVLVRTRVSLVSAGTEKLIIDLASKPLLEKARERPDLVKQVMNKIGTEGLIATARKVFTKLDNEVALGYSCAGEVVCVGGDAGEFRLGDRVACAGVGYASHSEVNFVPKNLCVQIPDNVDFEDASFTTVGAIAMQGIRRCGLESGERVAVIGLGLIGQLTVQILAAYGFPVLGIDIDERKVYRSLELGLSRGAVVLKDNVEEIAKAFSVGHGVDAVIITASTRSSQPVELAGSICRQGGRVVAVGMVGMEIPRNIYYEKELDFKVSRSYGPGRYDPDYEDKGIDYPYPYVRWTEKRNMEEFLRLCGSGRLNIKTMITHKFRIDEYKKAYEIITADAAKEYYSGILLEYDMKDEIGSLNYLNKKTPRGRHTGKVNIGVIGAGNFTKGVILPNLEKIKGIDIKAVASAHGSNADRVGRKYGCEYCTTDYREILEDDSIDTVVITTRHNLHASLALESLKNGKNVFVEKPLCINEQELSDIASFFSSWPKDKKLPLFLVGFNRRFSPRAADAKKAFLNRGTPLMINYRINAGHIPPGHWTQNPSEGGGRIVGEICHFIDVLQFITGSAPQKVYATAIPVKDGVQAADNLDIAVDFADGSRASILYTSAGDKKLSKEYMEIFCGGRSFVIDDYRVSGLFPRQDKGHAAELKAFINAVTAGGTFPIPLSEIFMTTLTTFKIQESLKTGMPVAIDLNRILRT